MSAVNPDDGFSYRVMVGLIDSWNKKWSSNEQR